MQLDLRRVSGGAPAASEGERVARAGELAGALERMFGVSFAVVDGASGELLEAAIDEPAGDWPVRGELCREVARRGRPELLAEEDPFMILALPVPAHGDDRLVAVATFVTRRIGADEDLSRAAAALGMRPAEAVSWAARQTPWPAEALVRMGNVALAQLAAQRESEQRETEVESLSRHIAATYEEITLLHRLTQNLKISKSDEDLGRLALQWMKEVLPAECVALQLVSAGERAESLGQQGRRQPMLLARGRCPVDNDRFTQLVEHLTAHQGHENRPLVANRGATQGHDWPCPQVRQIVLVPMADGEKLFGHLAAMNHVADGEFGTNEASLLNSVAVILGIHSANIGLYREQAELLAGVVRALTAAIDAKDEYTCGHSDRVARISVRLAQELGCDLPMRNTIYLAGLLHDIGKIGIADSVLRKPGKLSEDEYQHIMRHTEIGHRILRDLRKLEGVLPVILHHHESWNGAGYPLHLQSSQIPLAARIVAVADAYDAMGSDRPYRKGMSDEKIDAIFLAGSGQQWDPDVVDAFFRAREDLRRIASTQRSEVKVDLRDDPRSVPS